MARPSSLLPSGPSWGTPVLFFRTVMSCTAWQGKLVALRTLKLSDRMPATAQGGARCRSTVWSTCRHSEGVVVVQWQPGEVQPQQGLQAGKLCRPLQSLGRSRLSSGCLAGHITAKGAVPAKCSCGAPDAPSEYGLQAGLNIQTTVTLPAEHSTPKPVSGCSIKDDTHQS